MDIVFIILCFVWVVHFLVLACVMQRFGHGGMWVFALSLLVASAQTWLIQAFVPGLQWTMGGTMGDGVIDRNLWTAVAVLVSLGGWFTTRSPDSRPGVESGSTLFGLMMCIPGLSVLAGMYALGQPNDLKINAVERKQEFVSQKIDRETQAIWDDFEAHENRHNPVMRDDSPQSDGPVDRDYEADLEYRPRRTDDRDRIDL
ncbi:MAG: hypothetical protein Alpg2KO_08420 [Alphaproteobacteria bacterium]